MWHAYLDKGFTQLVINSVCNYSFGYDKLKLKNLKYQIRISFKCYKIVHSAWYITIIIIELCASLVSEVEWTTLWCRRELRESVALTGRDDVADDGVRSGVWVGRRERVK